MRPPRRFSSSAASRAIPLVLGLTLAGCTAFALPRPARVEPGSSFTTTFAVATPPGDPAAWFWGAYCTGGCNRTMISPAFRYMYGIADSIGAGRSEVGLGLNGLFPFVEGYVRLDRPGQRAFGLGARAGIPWQAGVEHQLYARIDLREGADETIFLNPTLFLHLADGSFTALAGVVGMHESGLTLSAAPVVGWTSRPLSAIPDERSGVALFLLLSASFTLGGERFGEGAGAGP